MGPNQKLLLNYEGSVLSKCSELCINLESEIALVSRPAELYASDRNCFYFT